MPARRQSGAGTGSGITAGLIAWDCIASKERVIDAGLGSGECSRENLLPGAEPSQQRAGGAPALPLWGLRGENRGVRVAGATASPSRARHTAKFQLQEETIPSASHPGVVSAAAERNGMEEWRGWTGESGSAWGEVAARCPGVPCCLQAAAPAHRGGFSRPGSALCRGEEGKAALQHAPSPPKQPPPCPRAAKPSSLLAGIPPAPSPGEAGTTTNAPGCCTTCMGMVPFHPGGPAKPLGSPWDSREQWVMSLACWQPPRTPPPAGPAAWAPMGNPSAEHATGH